MPSDFLQHCYNNYNLQTLNTLAVPSVAEYFVDVNTDILLLAALKFSQESGIPLTILGGGSNVLLSEKITGLVIKISTQGRELLAEDASSVTLRFAAGENWHDIVLWCVKKNLYGIENLALIPGTIGAAPIQNIGAYGVELMSCLGRVEGLYRSTNSSFLLDNSACLFAYRDSIFKQAMRNKVVITHVTLNLSKVPKPHIEYPALQEQLGKNKANRDILSPFDIASAVIAIRQHKLPNPKQIPNAGSFFKNPIVDELTYRKIHSDYPNLVAYPMVDKRYKLAAGWLIEQAGWRGKLVDNICMHSSQGLVLTNPNYCSTKQLLGFVNKVRESIFDKFTVNLEIEPIQL